MFKRKLFKRALPIILSVAMMFESMPATALASEATETAAEAETTVVETEAGTTDLKEPEGEEESGEESKDPLKPEEETEGEETQEQKALEGKTEPTEGSREETEPSGTKTEEPVASETEGRTEETEASEAKSTENATDAETAGESTEVKEVAEGEENAKLVTKLELDDDINTNRIEGFTRIYGEFPLTFTTEYRQDSKCGEFQEKLKNFITIKVDDQETSETAKANFTYKWAGKKEGAEGEDAYTETVSDPVPTKVGDYKLTITLAAEKDTWSEASMDVYVTIQPAELEISFKDRNDNKIDYLKIDPGKTVKDLKDQLEKNYVLTYKNGDTKVDDNSVLVEKFTAVVREAGSETDLQDTDVLNAKTGYEVKVELELKDKTNYNVTTADYYKVEVGDLQDTRVEVALDGVNYPVTKVYNDTDSTVFADLFAKTAKVFVINNDGDDEELTAAEGETLAVPGWYRREQAPGVRASGDVEIREDGSILYGDEPELKYVKLAEGETPEEAGEYYVIWMYAGDDKNAYNASASAPVAATIEPAPVVITIANDSDSLGSLFHEGMDYDDVQEALKEIDYKVSTLTDGKVNDDDVKTEDFFGVTYTGDDENQKEQYYKPLFKLQRAISKQKDTTIEEKDREWDDNVCPSANNGKLVNSDDDHEYVYRVIFTGDKGIYDREGKLITTDTVSVTEVATNNANRNYLAKVDSVTLDENAVAVNMAATKEAVIDAQPIIDAFNSTYNNPTVGDGSVEKPAVKVYDENALFTNRAAYKQAQVKDGSNVVASATDGLTYNWRYTSLKQYEDYMELTDEAKKATSFDKYANWWDLSYDELGNTEYDNGNFDSAVSANVYELTISYKDPEHNYWAKEKKVYFKVEKQQIVIVPGDQVAQNGQQIGDWYYNEKVPGLDTTLLAAYKIPNNVKSEYDAVGEDKSSLEVSLPSNAVINFEVQNKEKNSDGTNKDNYVETTHDIFDKDNYEYGLVATYDGANYTTEYVVDGVTEDYTAVSVIKFIGEEKIYVAIDKDKVQSLTKQYDGNPITLPDGIITLYSDKDMTKDVTAEMLNTTSEYDPEKVNLYWQNDRKAYTTENVMWGGEYTLALRFKGNETYRPISETEVAAEETYYIYGDTKVFYNNNDDYTFKITPRDITITPQLKTDVKAGETVDKLLLDAITVEGDLVDKDRVFFEYAELANGSYEDHYIVYNQATKEYYTVDGIYDWGSVDKYGGYPAFRETVRVNLVDEDGGVVEQWNEIHHAPHFKYQVNDKDLIGAANEEYLRFGSKYAVKLDNALVAPLADSYNVTWNPASVTIAQRGQGKVTKGTWAQGAVELKYAYDGSTYTIKPREAAPFYEKINITDKVLGDKNVGKDLKGNFISYNIYAPTEFENDFDTNKTRFFYAEAIANAGGYVVRDWTSDVDGHYITVIFPVTEDDKVRAFNIIWEEGYTDTFQFEGVELEADLTKAVAPKSIAFNTVQTKMAVGETQQLDVKITKRQLGDVIKLQYRIAGTVNDTKNQFISIDPDTGIVTALHTEKKATTQIEAYPVYLDKDGKYVEITDKGVKTAKTKITVTDVAAPSVKKVIPQDETAKVQFTDAGNGYRREIYVIETKKAKAADFESKIASMQNNQWEKAGFAVAPVYSYATSASSNYDAKTKLITETVTGLVPGRNYVVYVRNVSAVRKLDDGSEVDLSVKGGVKAFVALKSQVQKLEPYFNVDKETNTPVGKSTVRYFVDEDGDWNPNGNAYEVELLSKSAQISVDGLFVEKYDGNTAAEDKDLRRYALPLTKVLQANYYNPKLTYGVFDYPAVKWENGQLIYLDPWDAKQEASKFATISNKGKITLKGTSWDGEKTVYIYVKSDNAKFNWVSLTIKAEPTAITGKKAKLKVGDDKQLAEFLEYKQGTKKIPEYKSTQISISDEMIEAAAAAGYKIYDSYDYYVEDGDKYGSEHRYGYYDGDYRRYYRVWHIVAMSPNKSPFRLTVTDKTADGTELTATVTLTAAALDPVKNLKKAYVDDKNITINFKHAGNPYGYEIALVDARKNVVLKKFVQAVEKDSTSNIETWEQKKQSWIVNGLEYFGKTDTFAYTITDPKIVRLSSYTVSVTPVYDAQKGKTVTTKVKTTDIPASRKNVDATQSGKGGMTISHTYAYVKDSEADGTISLVEADVTELKNLTSLYDSPYFQSGNTYTLVASDETESKDRTTDKLTWKSSNTKVATVKANAGTYTATLRALRAGDTTITVTSKITKKVIARYDIRVKAVGNGNGFAGGYEPTTYDDFYKVILAQWDPFYEGRLEILSATDKLVVDAASDYDRTWVSFTAPTYGKYVFSADTGLGNAYNGKSGDTFKLTSVYENGVYIGQEATLEAGQKIYFRLNGSFTLEVVKSTNFARLTTANNAANPLEVRADKVEGWIAFTAPENNVYKFVSNKAGLFGTPKKDNVEDDYDERSSETTLDGKTTTYYATKGLKAGETLFIQVNNIEDAKLWVEFREVATDHVLVIGSKDTVSDELTKDKMTVYAKFTALQTGKYTFETEVDRDKDKGANLVTAEIFEADGNKPLKDADSIIPKSENKASIAAINADEETTDKQTIGVYMDAGQTVIVKFTIPDENISRAFGDLTAADQSKNELKDSKYAVKVKVSTEVGSIAELKVDSEATVTKDTTKTFQFNVTENGKYEFNVTNAAGVKYFNSKYESVDGLAGSNATLVVDDNSAVKVGDTIYVEVKAMEGDGAEDAKIIVSKVKVTALTAGTPVDLVVKGDATAENWYTFTAAQDGVYTFAAEPVQNTKTEGDQTVNADTHTANIVEYQKVFGSVKTPSNMTQELKAGQTVVYKVATALTTTGDTKAEDVQTTIKVSMTAMAPEAISTGDKAITLEKSGNEVIYKFTAVDTDDYTIKFTRDDKDETATEAAITVSTSLTGSFTSVSKKALYAGQVLYIKAKANSDNAKGTLNISAAKATTEKLESGVAKSFNFEKKAGEKTYSYIAPRDGVYGILVKLDENAGTLADLTLSWENYSVDPVAAQSDISLNAEGYAVLSYDFEKGQTIKVTLASNNTTDDVKGSITIQPTTPEEATAFTGTVETKVSAGKNAYYEYTIPAYGRYSFTLSNVDVNVNVQKKALNGPSASASLSYAMNGGLFNKNDVVYLTVSTNKAEEQTATLKAEALNNVTALTVDTAADVTIAKGAQAFYQFTAPERAEYNFRTIESVEGKFTGSVSGVYKFDDMSNNNLVNGATLDKDERVLIVFNKAYGDDVQFKYTVKKTGINVLKEGTESKVTIKVGEPAAFEFPILNEGIYAFSVSGEGMTVNNLANNARTATVNGNTLYEGNPENATFVVNEYDRTNAVQKFTVTYNKPATEGAADEAQATVKVTKIEPKKLTADAAEESITINKGECAIVSFVPAVTARYAFTTGNDLVNTYKNGFVEKVFTVGNDKENEPYKTIILTVSDNEAKDNKSETAKVKVTTVKAVEITASPAVFKATGAEQTFWYEFKASKNARYDFEVTNGKDKEDEKVVYSSARIEEYKELRDLSGSALSTKLMKKDDTVLIKVTVSGVAKDEDVKFNITETEVPVFEEVVFKSTSGLTNTKSFTAKKDKLYTVSVIKDKAGVYSNVKTEYTDKDKATREDAFAINGGAVEIPNIDADTKVDVTITVGDKPVDTDTVFYIFVEEKDKPKEDTPSDDTQTPQA